MVSRLHTIQPKLEAGAGPVAHVPGSSMPARPTTFGSTAHTKHSGTAPQPTSSCSSICSDTPAPGSASNSLPSPPGLYVLKLNAARVPVCSARSIVLRSCASFRAAAGSSGGVRTKGGLPERERRVQKAARRLAPACSVTPLRRQQQAGSQGGIMGLAPISIAPAPRLGQHPHACSAPHAWRRCPPGYRTRRAARAAADAAGPAALSVAPARSRARGPMALRGAYMATPGRTRDAANDMPARGGGGHTCSGMRTVVYAQYSRQRAPSAQPAFGLQTTVNSGAVRHCVCQKAPPRQRSVHPPTPAPTDATSTHSSQAAPQCPNSGRPGRRRDKGQSHGGPRAPTCRRRGMGGGGSRRAQARGWVDSA